MQPETQEVQTEQPSILAIHPGALGDVILFGHLLSSLPGRVTLVAGGQKARLLAGCNIVAGAMDFDALPMHEVFSAAPLGECRLPALLGGRDRLICCFGSDGATARRRLAQICGAASADFLPVRPPAGWDGHLLEYWRRLLKLPARGDAAAPWCVPDEWTAAATRALGRVGVSRGEPYIVLHPGAGATAKCWAAEKFVQLAEGLGKAAAVFVIGPVETDKWDARRIDVLRDRFATIISPELSVLAGLLRRARAYAGNDSGVSHLAGAVGAPTVALFGPTQPGQFAPIGPAVRTIHNDPLADLAVGEVDGVLNAFLGATRRG